MILELAYNEFTPQQLVRALNKRFHGKKYSDPFTLSDVLNYLEKGYLPKLYGGNRLRWTRKYGFTAITVMPKQKSK